MIDTRIAVTGALVFLSATSTFLLITLLAAFIAGSLDLNAWSRGGIVFAWAAAQLLTSLPIIIVRHTH